MPCHQKAFSLIELIFVILITGILAIVAIPKLAGVADEARVSKIKGFTGTLNRSTGPSLWIKVLVTTGGSVRNENISVGEEVDNIPNEFIDLGSPQVIALTTCMDANNTVPDIGAPVGALTEGKIAESIQLGEYIYVLGCIDGDGTSSPKFYLYDEVNGVIVY